MNLKPQIEEIKAIANDNDFPSAIVENYLIPLLVSHAKRLKRSHFFLWQHRTTEEWMIIRLQHRFKPELEKSVLYVFATAEDAQKHPDFEPLSLEVIEIPVLFLLFETLDFLGKVDSLVFYLHPKNYKKNIELEPEGLLTELRFRMGEKLDAYANILSRLA